MGKVDPDKEGANWKIKRKEPELRLDLKLEEALAAQRLYANGLDHACSAVSLLLEDARRACVFLETE